MRPYYDRDGVALFHADCRDLSSSLPQVDLVLADPPYGDTALKWDRWPDGWLNAVRPSIKATGSLWCFGSMRMFLAKAEEFQRDYRLAQDIIWEKHNGSGFHADRFKRVHEQALQFYPLCNHWEHVFKAPVKTRGHARKITARKQRPGHTGAIGAHNYDSTERLMRSVIRVRSVHGRAIHPTQKPEDIVDPLLRYSCPPGGLVLDPFAGSGTTLLVARQLGMRAIGIEADEAYCEAAARRLSETLPLGSAA